METKTPPSSRHSTGDRKLEHPEKKRIKLDRSGLKLNVSKSSSVSNGVKSEGKAPDEKPQVVTNNVKKEIVSQEKPPLKRPAVSDSEDDTPLVVRSKQKVSHSSKDTKISKSPLKDSRSSNDIKKIKKSNLNGSPKLEKPKKLESSDGVENQKKIKPESGLTSPNKAGSVKKIKPESGTDKTDGIKKLKLDPGSPKVDGVKKVKSETSAKKVKSESGLTSPSKSSSSVKNDNTNKVKHELDVSLKIKSESGLKSPDGIKKSKESLLSPKTDGIKKKTSSSSPKVDGSKTKEGSSIKTEKDKHKTASSKESSGLLSPKTDGIKKEKHKTSSSGSSKHEGTPKTNVKKDSSVLTSPKVEAINKDTQKVSSPKVDGAVKKIKTESGDTSSSSTSKSSSESPKKSSSSSGTPKLKVEGIKKIKTESGSSSSPKVSSGNETTKTSMDETDDDDDVPLATRAKPKTNKTPDSKKKTPPSSSKDRKRKGSDDENDDEYKPVKKLKKKSDVGGKDVKKEVKTKKKVKPKKENDAKKTPGKGKEGKAKEKKEEEVWKWWEEEKLPEGIKWLKLEHKGPYFPPKYEAIPDSVNFYYNGEKVKLSLKSEEVAGFYAKMLDHDYTSKKIFSDNFFKDWRKEMTDEERKLITHLSKCDFKEMHAYFTQKNEERKNKSKEEKLKLKAKNEEILEEYGYCMMDGHKERVGNFKIEPPGLFRGRGDHPKQGKLKKRLQARDVIINIGKDAQVPDPPEGQRWKSVQHDNKVTWLACWIENIQGSYKYVMLNPTSRIKGEKDWQKYETARKLKTKIGKIREDYTNDWRAKEMRIRQRGVALYFIDKLALRAGHEKDEDTADTVGCCSLRYEHIKLHKQLEGKEYVVVFDFLGKDSIQYHNVVEVEKRVFKNLELFQQGKSEGDDLFDRLSTQSLNKYLSELMEGLSAKVFRTYNASMTLQDQLNKLELEDNVAANVLGYNRANRAVAILCNHQRSAPKTFEQSMSNLQQKIDDKGKAIKDAKNELKDLKHEAKRSDSVTLERRIEKKKTAIERLKEQLFKLEVSQTDKNENKEIALGTSKLNYLDPRISIAWCLKNDVPIEKIYNKTQRQKFAWAIDMTEEDFVF